MNPHMLQLQRSRLPHVPHFHPEGFPQQLLGFPYDAPVPVESEGFHAVQAHLRPKAVRP